MPSRNSLILRRRAAPSRRTQDRFGNSSTSSERPGSQFAGAARLRLLPQSRAAGLEDQLRILRGRVPVVMLDLAVELPRTPASIAEGDDALFRPLMVRDVDQDLP